MTGSQDNHIPAATLEGAGLERVLDGPDARGAAGPNAGIGYFALFGVDERMIRGALAAAMSRGGDHADLFFQHRVTNHYGLEDGAVNRAFKSVELGVGVRVVKGDQTGYGFTEDLTREGLELAARTAATIADGPSREIPQALHAATGLPSRYPQGMRWEDVKAEQKLPILTGLNERTLRRRPADPQGEPGLHGPGQRHPDRRLRGPHHRGRAADDDAVALVRRRAGRTPRAERQQRRGPRRLRLLHRGAHRRAWSTRRWRAP